MGDAWTENCRLCAAPLPTLLDAGGQPRATDYALMPQSRAETWPKRFGCCPRCGLAQLLCPPPAAWLAPCVDWLAFNEPESHLDALAAQLTQLTGRGCAMAGLSLKDAGLLERLTSLGGRESWRLTPDILGLDGARPMHIALVQESLSAPPRQSLPPVRLLVARHILEHVHNLPRFLYTARKLIREDGWLFVEVPACEAELQSCDYARLWEEHTQYFTDVSLSNTLMMGGFSPLWTQRTRTGQEELLLVLARKTDPATVPLASAEDTARECSRARFFADRYAAIARRIRSRVNACKGSGSVALLGVGHLGVTFTHLMGLAGHIGKLWDDHPRKQGHYVAGLTPCIAPSAALDDSDTTLCLLAVPPEAEDRILQQHSAFIQRGGIFASVFPQSRLYIGHDAFIVHKAPLATSNR